MRQMLRATCLFSMAALAACSGAETDDGGSSGASSGGVTASGGDTSTGSTPGSGGAFGSGGSIASGGATGSGGDTSSGGLASGGTLAGGAPSTGGWGTGGDATGGVSSGGIGTGGAATGGVSTGGDASTGGTASGGTSSGGASTGGTASGGTSTGGAASADVPNTAACADYSDWDEAWRTREEDILELVNVERLAGTDCATAKNAVGTLTMDPVLRCAARMHAQDMAERAFFSHGTWDDAATECNASAQNACPPGQICDDKLDSGATRCLEGPGARLDVVDYTGNTWGENIAAGNSGATGTMTQWMNSSGHCNNIMNGNFKKIGVGYAPGGPYGHVWVQVFGN